MNTFTADRLGGLPDTGQPWGVQPIAGYRRPNQAASVFWRRARRKQWEFDDRDRAGGGPTAIVKRGVRDGLWAVGVGVLVAIGPHSSSKISVSAVCGALAFGATLAWRHRYPDARPRVWARPPTLFWVVLAAYAFLLSAVSSWLFGEYTHGIWWNGHGLLVPLAMALLTDRILRKDIQEAPADADATSVWGVAVVAAGCAMVAIDCGIRSQYLSLFGLLSCLPGFSLALLGPRRTRLLWLPLLLGLFLMPIPTRYALDLQLPQLISRGVVEIMGWFGFSVVRVGTAVSLPAGGFNVSEDCSGFAAFYASYAIVLVLAVYNRSRAKIALLLVAPWLLAVAVNVPRGTVLLLGANYFGMEFLGTFWHTASGIVAFWLMVLPLLLLADRATLREKLG